MESQETNPHSISKRLVENSLRIDELLFAHGDVPTTVAHACWEVIWEAVTNPIVLSLQWSWWEKVNA